MISKIKKVIFLLFVIVFIISLGYFGKGAYDYFDWVKTKQAIAGGGYTNLYAGTLGTVTPSCTYTVSGCTCSFCNTCGCNSYDQAIISVGQEVNKGAMYLCVSSALQVKGTPLISSASKQFIAGSLSGQCLTANAIMATPSLAATNFERFANFIDKYIIAGFAH